MISRKTAQKEQLEQAVTKQTSFFTAEDLHEKVAPIGIATVYRYLSTLRKQKKLHSYSCKKKTIYSKQAHSHSHFTCEKCGKVEHINIKELDFLDKHIKGSICHFQVEVSGTCKECNKKIKGQDS